MACLVLVAMVTLTFDVNKMGWVLFTFFHAGVRARVCVYTPVGPAAWLQELRGSVGSGCNKPVVCNTPPRRRCSQFVLLLLSLLERHLLLEQRHRLPELHTQTHTRVYFSDSHIAGSH